MRHMLNWAVGREDLDRTPSVNDASNRPSITGPKALEDGELEEWLGVRDGIRNWLLTAA